MSNAQKIAEDLIAVIISNPDKGTEVEDRITIGILKLVIDALSNIARIADAQERIADSREHHAAHDPLDGL